ncbi:MAG: sensor histidine kinase [Rubrivivax sp.]|nr:MAG: sensor histidine kinase [Rubrivivax sp.]
MNDHRFWRRWGIAARLLAIAVLPASVMFVAVSAALYASTMEDVRRDVDERGQLVATALAQSSQYALVSGNTAYLATTLRDLLRADRSIACIVVNDRTGREVVSDCRRGASTAPDAFEVPVRIETLPEVDLFNPVPGGDATPPGQAVALRTVGLVRVSMSTAPVVEARRQALLWSFALVLAAAGVSCWIGLRLARQLRRTMVSVMAALRHIRKGHFDIRLANTHDGELGELQRTILQMASTLAATRHDLEQQVADRTRALQDAVDRLRQADHEKRRLIAHSNALVEEDRRRVALEIHDHLGAALISVRLEASALIARATSQGDDEVARGARRIATTAESLYSSTRSIVKSLRPEVIDTLGLAGAVEELVRGFDQVHPDCRFTFRADAGLPELRGEQAMPAYRVAQEALANVVKHARATRAVVTLGWEPDTGRVNLVVQDNGVGFDAAASGGTGVGLVGMRERVAAVGGELSLRSSEDEGTRVSVTFHARPPVV